MTIYDEYGKIYQIIQKVRVRVPPNSNKLQVYINGGTGSIRAGMIVYPTK